MLRRKANPSIVAVTRPTAPMEETFQCTRYRGWIAPRDID
jgi:hypothetical protein